MNKDDPSLRSQLIIQVLCNTSIADEGGRPVGALRNGNVTRTIPETTEGDSNAWYGRHESLTYYQKCKARERNRGLYVSDQATLTFLSLHTQHNQNALCDK